MVFRRTFAMTTQSPATTLHLFSSAFCRTLVQSHRNLGLDTLVPALCHGFGNLGVLLLIYDVFASSLPYRTAKFSALPIRPEGMASRYFLPKLVGVPPRYKQLTVLHRRLVAGFLLSQASHRSFFATRRFRDEVYTIVNNLVF